MINRRDFLRVAALAAAWPCTPARAAGVVVNDSLVLVNYVNEHRAAGIPIAKSVMDYVFRYLGNRFLQGEPEVADEQEDDASVGLPATGLRAAVAGGSGGSPAHGAYGIVNQTDAPSCQDCGAIMIRNGACYKCPNCGSSSGCS